MTDERRRPQDHHAPLTHTPFAGLANLVELAEDAKGYAEHAKADNTRRAYESDWRAFKEWCQAEGMVALPAPAEVVTLYITHLANEGLKTGTISRALAAIGQYHRFAGKRAPNDDVMVTETMRGIRRQHGTLQDGKAPAVASDLCKMLDTCADNLAGTRDRAILSLGWGGAFRRSEVAALDIRDVTLTREGMVVLLRKSKTDQEGKGREVAIPRESDVTVCPILNFEAWMEGLEELNLHAPELPLFRRVDRWGHIGPHRITDKAIALVVKRAAEAAGLDPERFAGHSLRSGFATSAAMAGVEERHIMNQTGHKSLVVVRRYIRQGTLFKNHAGMGLLSNARKGDG
jgi:site-specific recombinase XerD